MVFPWYTTIRMVYHHKEISTKAPPDVVSMLSHLLSSVNGGRDQGSAANVWGRNTPERFPSQCGAKARSYLLSFSTIQ